MLVVASWVCAGIAGIQAARLLDEAGGQVARLTRQLAEDIAAREQIERRLEAQQILLKEAGAWMRAQRPNVPLP